MRNIRQDIKPRARHASLIALVLAFTTSLVAGQTSSDGKPQILQTNQVLEREIKGKEVHHYRVDLKKDEFFQVHVEQKGVDLVLRIADERGNILAIMDSSNGEVGTETLSFVASKVGSYTLEVNSFDVNAKKGVYIIKREVSRKATTKDRRRVEVERLFIEGLRARDSQDQLETAIARFEEANRGWLELRDDYLAQLTQRLIKQTKELQAQSNVHNLLVGTTTTYRLKGGEFHIHQIELKQGQALQIDTQEKGVDVLIALVKVWDKQPITKSDFGFGYDRETLTTEVEESGKYAVLVGSRESALSGSYELTAQIKEAATQAESERIEAGRLLGEGLASLKKDSAIEVRGAVAKLERAAVLWKKLEEKYWEGYTNNVLGRVYNMLGEKQKALNYFTQALSLRRTVADKSGEAQTLNNIGKAYAELGEHQKALDYYNQALSLSRAIGDKNGEAGTLNNIGGAYAELGEHQKALDYYDHALPLSRLIGDRSGEAVMLNNIGGLYAKLGEKQQAIDYYNQALPLSRAIGDKNGEAGTLNNIGGAYAELGEHQKAIDYYKQALLLSKAIGDKGMEAVMLNNLGRAYAELGEHQKALDYYDHALPLSRLIGDRSGEAVMLNNIGGLYAKLDEKQQAIDYYNRALLLFKAAANKIGEASALNNIGMVYAELSKRKALDYYNQALLISRIIGDKAGEAATLKNMMYVLESLDDWQMAVFYGKLSINKYQELRGANQGLDNEIQKSFLRSIQVAYRKLAELMIENGQLVQAVESLTLYRNQESFDFISDPSLPVRQIAFTQREYLFAQRYQAESNNIGQINTQVAELKRQIGNHQPTNRETEQLQNLEAKFKTASDAFLAILKDAEKQFAESSGALAEITYAQDLTEMQVALRELDATTKQKLVILYTFIGSNKFHILLITPDGTVKHFASTIKAADLNDKILRFYAVLQSPTYDPRYIGKELYDIIFKPAEAELKKTRARTLLWSLDGRLRYVPMAALWDGEKYLVERYQNVSFTRINLNRMTRSASRDWTGIGFGSSQAQTVALLGNRASFPALPGVTAELRGIFKTQPTSKTGILKGEVFIDGQFTKASFYKAMRARYPVVHIAGHFSFRPGDNMRSFLLLGDGAMLTLNEMKEQKQLFEGVELLVLSGGNTAATRPDATGKEVDAFAELAQRLGAEAIMATLWSVSDASTPQLMRAFYAKRASKDGMTKAEALRQAQLELLNTSTGTKPLRAATRRGGLSKVRLVIVSDESKQTRKGNETMRADIVYVNSKKAPPFKQEAGKPFAHPYYWSPFVLIGNCR